MNDNYTDNQLIQYIYGELDTETTKMMRRRTYHDVELKERLHALHVVHESLSEVHHKPSQSSVNIIMKYSKNMEEMQASY